MRDLPFFYYGMLCFSLTLFGLVLTIVEFRSWSKNPLDPKR